MKTYKFDHYYVYSEITELLQALREEYPNLVKLSSICTSLENREVWACEITNYATGDVLSKPAFYVDGNHHAGEVTGSMAALHLIHTLVTKYGADEKITALLDKNAVYVIPRISPDGAEIFLTSAAKLRSVPRAYPYEKPAPGLHQKDMDGDGVIRMMRIESADGVWKPSKEDPRVMVKRSPSDFGGKYYNVYPEGYIEGYDGINIQPAEVKWGLDFNRNYPLGWFPENRQPGAGKYPLSNPENKAVADFVIGHPNICCGITYHTNGGCYIYPPGTMPEKMADRRDMRMFKEIGAMATEETGYACFNIFDGFLTDTVNYSSGAFDDWMYSTQGIPTYTAELWDIETRAGVPDVFNGAKPKTDKENERDMHLIYKWIDANCPPLPTGKPIMDWTEFDHPQLGKVEIGGMDFKNVWQNPPPGFLEQEVKKNTNFCLRMAMTLPILVVDSLTSEKIGEDVYKVTVKVSNTGYLPSFVCNEAKRLKVDKELKIKANVEGVFVTGKAEDTLGHLEGFSGVKSSYSWDNIHTFEHDPVTKAVTWIVQAKAGTEFAVEISGPKAGIVKATVTL